MKPTSSPGDGPYTFVCYAHADSERVYALISWLQENGIGIWYDEGITPGEEWNEELSQAIEGAVQLLYLVSPTAVASRHCRNEIRHAVNHDKRIVTAYLEPTDLSGGLELLIGGSQALEVADDAPANGILLDTLRGAELATTRRKRGVSRWPAVAGAMALAIALASYLFINAGREQPESTPPTTDVTVPELALAVMPFRSVSQTPDTNALASGVHADVMSHLYRLSEVVVMSALAVERFAGARPRDIAEELRVSHILDGRVQSTLDQVRISVELVDALTEQRIWSSQFERQLSDIFTIQSEIAISVANQLAIKLSPEQIDEIGEIPTENMDAFRLYTRARTTDDIDVTLELLEQAIALDPEYAQAHRLLSLTLRRSAFPRSTILDKMVDHADTALALAPSDPYAHWERGQVALVEGRPTVERLRRAYELAPNNGLFGITYAYALDIDYRAHEWVPLVESIRRRNGNFRPVPLRFWMNDDHDGYRDALRNEIDALHAASLDRSLCNKDPWCEFANSEDYRAYELAKAYRNSDDYVQLVAQMYRARNMRKPEVAVPIDIPRLMVEGFEQLGDHEAADNWLAYLDRDGADPSAAFRKVTILRVRGDAERLTAHYELWRSIDTEFAKNMENSLQRTQLLATKDPASRRTLNEKIYAHAQAFLAGNEAYQSGGLPFGPTLSLYFAIGIAPTDPEEAAHIAGLVIDLYRGGAVHTLQGYFVIGERYAELTYAHALRGELDLSIESYLQAERYAYRAGLGWGGVYQDHDSIFHGLATHPELLAIDKRIRAKNMADVARIKAELPFTRDPNARPFGD